MKGLCLGLCIGVGTAISASADLTIVEKVEGVGGPSMVTIKVQGNMLRVDATPDISTIFDASSGEMTQVLKAQKAVIRFSGETLKSMTEVTEKHSEKKDPAAKGKISPTGKRERIGNYDAEEYTTDAAGFKASYWVAKDYPNAATIFRQLQAIKPPSMDFAKMGIPDFTELPGLPIKTVMSVGGTLVTSTIISVNQNPVDPAEFAVPPDFQEMKMPNPGMVPGEEPAAGESPKEP